MIYRRNKWHYMVQAQFILSVLHWQSMMGRLLTSVVGSLVNRWPTIGYPTCVSFVFLCLYYNIREIRKENNTVYIHTTNVRNLTPEFVRPNCWLYLPSPPVFFRKCKPSANPRSFALHSMARGEHLPKAEHHVGGGNFKHDSLRQLKPSIIVANNFRPCARNVPLVALPNCCWWMYLH